MAVAAEKYTRYKGESNGQLQATIDRAVEAYRSATGEKKEKIKALIEDLRREVKIREYREEYKREEEEGTGWLGNIERTLDSYADTLLLGQASEIGAGLQSIFGKKSYDENLDEWQILEEARKRDKSGWEAGVGTAAGVVGSIFTGGNLARGTKLGAAAKAKPKTTGAAVAGGSGAIYGAGGPGTLEERAENALSTGAISAPLGAAAPVVGGWLGKAIRNPGTTGAGVGAVAGAGEEAYDQFTDPNKDFNPLAIASQGAGGAALGLGVGKTAGAAGRGLFGQIGETAKQTASKTLAGTADKSARYSGPGQAVRSHLDQAVDKTVDQRVNNISSALKSIIWGNIQAQISSKFFKGKGWGSAGKLQAAGGQRALIRELKDFIIKVTADQTGYQSPKMAKTQELFADMDGLPLGKQVEIMKKAGFISNTQANKILRGGIKSQGIGKDLSPAKLKKVQEAVDEIKAEGFNQNLAIGGVVGRFASTYGRRLYNKLRAKGFSKKEADEIASASEAKTAGMAGFSHPRDGGLSSGLLGSDTRGTKQMLQKEAPGWKAIEEDKLGKYQANRAELESWPADAPGMQDALRRNQYYIDQTQDHIGTLSEYAQGQFAPTGPYAGVIRDLKRDRLGINPHGDDFIVDPGELKRLELGAERQYHGPKDPFEFFTPSGPSNKELKERVAKNWKKDNWSRDPDTGEIEVDPLTGRKMTNTDTLDRGNRKVLEWAGKNGVTRFKNKKGRWNVDQYYLDMYNKSGNDLFKANKVLNDDAMTVVGRTWNTMSRDKKIEWIDRVHKMRALKNSASYIRHGGNVRDESLIPSTDFIPFSRYSKESQDKMLEEGIYPFNKFIGQTDPWQGPKRHKSKAAKRALEHQTADRERAVIPPLDLSSWLK